MVIEEWVLMAHGKEPDVYDYLATSKVSDVTVAQLQEALENSFINKSNIEFWKGPITVSRLLEVSRTYSHGLPVPGESAVFQYGWTADETFVIQPPGTELWEIAAIEGFGTGASADLKFSYSDGIADVGFKVVTVIQAGTKVDLNDLTPTQVRINNSLHFKVENTNTVPGILVVAYHKRSL